MVRICSDKSIYTITNSPSLYCNPIHSREATMFSKNITCTGCGHKESIEIGGPMAHPSSEIFCSIDHRHVSNNLYFRCPCCGAGLAAVDPPETINARQLREFPSPVNSSDDDKHQEKSPLSWWSLSLVLSLCVILLIMINLILTKL